MPRLLSPDHSSFLQETLATPRFAAELLQYGELETGLTQAGLPRFRSGEAWKYSNPSKLVETLRQQDSDPCLKVAARNAQCLALSDAEAVSLVQYHLLSPKLAAKHPLGAVVLLRMTECSVLKVSRGAEARIEISCAGTGAAPSVVLVVLEPGAAAEIVEQGVPQSALVACVLKEQATLRHLRLQPADQGHEYNLVYVRVGQSASYELRQHLRGSGLRRNDLWICLEGEGARSEINGGWRVGAGEHVDLQISLDHVMPHTTSHQKFHGVVTDGGTSVFGGRIWIAPNAQRTDAALINRNLVDGTKSQAYTKPELEIYADDVKCSHGATVGQLESDALFYLRSRGVSRRQASSLLVAGFLKEVTRDERERELLGL